MSKIPHDALTLGGLRRHQKLIDINARLSDTAKTSIYPGLIPRFWCHAHTYSLVFPLIILDIIGTHLDRHPEVIAQAINIATDATETTSC